MEKISYRIEIYMKSSCAIKVCTLYERILQTDTKPIRLFFNYTVFLSPHRFRVLNAEQNWQTYSRTVLPRLSTMWTKLSTLSSSSSSPLSAEVSEPTSKPCFQILWRIQI